MPTLAQDMRRLDGQRLQGWLGMETIFDVPCPGVPGDLLRSSEVGGIG